MDHWRRKRGHYLTHTHRTDVRGLESIVYYKKSQLVTSGRKREEDTEARERNQGKQGCLTHTLLWWTRLSKAETVGKSNLERGRWTTALPDTESN